MVAIQLSDLAQNQKSENFQILRKIYSSVSDGDIEAALIKGDEEIDLSKVYLI